MKVIRKPLEKDVLIRSRAENCCNGCVDGPPVLVVGK